MRPNIEDIITFVEARSLQGEAVSTAEIITEFDERGYDIDRDWFWGHVAPLLRKAGAFNTLGRHGPPVTMH